MDERRERGIAPRRREDPECDYEYEYNTFQETASTLECLAIYIP